MTNLAGHPAEDGGLLEAERPNGKPIHQRITAGLMLPREHGAWAMLLMPFLLGTAAAGNPSLPGLLLFVAVLLLFTASRPMELLAQGGRDGAMPRLLAYGVAGAAAGVALLLAYGLWLLVSLGVAAGSVLGAQLLLRRRRLDRTWPARLASIAALSVAGPAAYYAGSAAIDSRALAVWIMAFLYSGASVFYVRLFYRQPERKNGGSTADGRSRAERQLAGYVVAAMTIVGGLGVAGVAPPLGTLSFVPLAVKAVLGCRWRETRPTLRQIGFAEMGHTALFLVLASATMLLW